jgi:hypothetical protein
MIKTEMLRVNISLSANSAVFLQQGVQRAEVPTPASCHRTPVLCSPLDTRALQSSGHPCFAVLCASFVNFIILSVR